MTSADLINANAIDQPLVDPSLVSAPIGPPQRILLVTGAGASRNLGAKGQLPLMSGWARILATAIDKKFGAKAAQSIGLGDDDISGPKFEEALGTFLAWTRAHYLNRTFTKFGAQDFVGVPVYVTNWHDLNEQRAVQVMATLHETLYDSFGSSAVSVDSARTAYHQLIQALGGKSNRYIVATTNYDVSVDIALHELGFSVNDGFPPSGLLRPRFDPKGLGRWERLGPDDVSILHLHGAVGWYRKRDNSIARYATDDPYNNTLGTPVILPPDRDKDPLGDAMVSDLWQEFRAAAEGATHIAVLGHSMGDTPLVLVLSQSSAPKLVLDLKPSDQLTVADRLTIEFGPSQMQLESVRSWVRTGTLATSSVTT
jgi:hypothetical protein